MRFAFFLPFIYYYFFKKFKKQLLQPESDRFRAISARFGPIWPKSEIEKKEKKRKKEKEKEKEKGFALDADAAVSRVTRRVRACQRPVWHPWSRTHTSQH